MTPANQSTPEVTRAGSLDYRISWPRPATPCNLEPLWKGEFASFEDWCNFASKRLTGTNNGRSEVKAICVDALGRRCSDGGDFMRARDEDAFPVRYFWECVPSATPARGGDELLIDLKGALEYSAGCDEGVDQDTASSEIMGWAGAWLSLAYDKICARIASSDMAGAAASEPISSHPENGAAPPVEGLTSGEREAREALAAAYEAAKSWPSVPRDIRAGIDRDVSSDVAIRAMLAFAAASPKATATASVREDEGLRDRISAAIDGMTGMLHSEKIDAILSALTHSGTAATIGGEGHG